MKKPLEKLRIVYVDIVSCMDIKWKQQFAFFVCFDRQIGSNCADSSIHYWTNGK